MNERVLKYIICPHCASRNFCLEAYLRDESGISEGRLICRTCSKWYRIENSILDLFPFNMRDNERYKEFSYRHNLKPDGDLSTKNLDAKKRQMHFFKKNINDYERNVVNSSYYQALDWVTFIEWMRRNLKERQLVLDLGCGTARQAISLAQHKINAVGIDISEEMLILANRKIGELGLLNFIDLIIGDAENPPVRDNYFDACVFYGTLHHVDDKEAAIANVSKKLVTNGSFFSLDPNKSPVRFIFDFLMKIWKLYNEEASDFPLLSCRDVERWLAKAGIKGKMGISTYLPPHIFYMFNVKRDIQLLKFTDAFFNKIPFVRDLGGVIFAEGVKKC